MPRRGAGLITCQAAGGLPAPADGRNPEHPGCGFVIISWDPGSKRAVELDEPGLGSNVALEKPTGRLDDVPGVAVAVDLAPGRTIASFDP